MCSMRVLIVEDDHFQSEALESLLEAEIPGTVIFRIRTEREFRQKFEEIALDQPDVVIMDIMLRWTDPSPSMDMPPQDVLSDGFYRAGLRCTKLLLGDPRTRRCHIVVYSALSHERLASDVAGFGRNAVFMSKAKPHEHLLQLLRFLSHVPALEHSVASRVFLAHGRDQAVFEMVARFIERMGLLPVVLSELPELGIQTGIEKLELNADVAFAVVILVPEQDETSGGRQSRRPSQSVILELGYLIGKIGRKNVCVVASDQVELPPELGGIATIALDSAGAWRMNLATEMRIAGLPINIGALL